MNRWSKLFFAFQNLLVLHLIVCDDHSIAVDAWTISFSPDSRFLATGSHSGKINLFGVESGRKEESLDIRGGFTLSIAYVSISLLKLRSQKKGRLYVFFVFFYSVFSLSVFILFFLSVCFRCFLSICFHSGFFLSICLSFSALFFSWFLEFFLQNCLITFIGKLKTMFDFDFLHFSHSFSLMSSEFTWFRYSKFLSWFTWNFFSIKSPDGKLIASGAIDGIINIFDTQTGRLIHTLEGRSI